MFVESISYSLLSFLLFIGLFLHLYFLNIVLNFTFLQSYLISKSSFLFSKCPMFIITYLYHGCNVFSYFEVFLSSLCFLWVSCFCFCLYVKDFCKIYDELCLLIFKTEVLKSHWILHTW